MIIVHENTGSNEEAVIETETQTTPDKISNKTIWIGAVVLAGIVLLTFTTIYRNLNGQDVWGAIKEISPLAVLACFALAFGYSFCEGLNIYRALKLAGYKMNILRCWKYAIVGFFYSGITPSSSGGQPMQIYSMYQDGIAVSDGLFAVIMQLFGHIGAIVLMAISGMAVMHHEIMDSAGHLSGLIILGIILYVLYFLFLLVVLFTRKGINIVSNVLIAIVSKFNRKGTGKWTGRIISVLEQYRNVFEIVRRDRHIIWKVLLTGVLQWSCAFGVQVVIYAGFGLSGFGMIKIILLQSAIQISVGFLPVPGSAGMFEGMAFLLYQLMYPAAFISAGILLGRCFSIYFIIVLYGIILCGIRAAGDFRKRRRKL